MAGGFGSFLWLDRIVRDLERSRSFGECHIKSDLTERISDDPGLDIFNLRLHGLAFGSADWTDFRCDGPACTDHRRSYLHCRRDFLSQRLYW